jgi:hypothetical protein
LSEESSVGLIPTSGARALGNSSRSRSIIAVVDAMGQETV